MSALCREFAISRPTGYLWLGRYREGKSIQELGEHSRRPQHSPQETAREVQRRVVELRGRRPDWGARKLRVLLQGEGIELPAVTIHRILQRHELILPRNRHRPAVHRFERATPNELWQLDFKGLPAHLARECWPLSVLDDHSRYAVGLFALLGTQAEPVRESLQQAFEAHGVPEQMLMDHGTPWWNMQSQLGLTALSVWLMKQGIALRFSGYRHPQTQGKVERFHRSLNEALLRRGLPPAGRWAEWLTAFRWEYNTLRPHEALNMATPASRWHRCRRAYDPQPKAWEYPQGAEVHKLNARGMLCLPGRRWFVCEALAQQWVQIDRLDHRVLVTYRRTLLRELDLNSGTTAPVVFADSEFERPGV
jgi:transposase InsO family protein